MKDGILYQELRRANPQLADEFDDIYREALKIWANPALRTFTEHGEKHTRQVERNLDVITRPLQKLSPPLNPLELTGPLKAHEIFVLLSACCLHDIGMQLDNPDARQRHAEYACSLILHSSARIDYDLRRVTLPINDDNAREAIALVARAHWTDFALTLEQYDNRIYENQRGRLSLLGLLLAMADLLDLSPVRASFFRSLHRLYELDPLARLHQTMHARVKGCEVLLTSQNGELQFELVWREGENDKDRNDIRCISDWIMTWFNSQWRLLEPALVNRSGGAIRWTNPWFDIQFTESLIPLEEEEKQLTPEARNILKAERIDQRRIDRDEFVESFKNSLKNQEAALLVIPWESDLDGGLICDWCEAYAVTISGCKVARANIGNTPATTTSLAGIISDLMAGWGEKWSECELDQQAIEQLELFLCNHDRSFVSIISSEGYRKKQLNTLLKALMRRSTQAQAAARICLLRIPEDARPRIFNAATVVTLSALPFTQQDIEKHLRKHLGYSENESHKIYTEKLSKLPNSHRPMMMYDYIETLYRLPSNCE